MTPHLSEFPKHDIMFKCYE